MTVEVFGVTAEAVRLDCFPHLPAFSTNTGPTASQVETKINEQAGMLTGALRVSGISTASIAADTAAYYSCAGVLKLMVGLACARSASGLNPEVVKAWRVEVNEWLKGLRENGATFLGDPSLESSSASPTGPNTHIEAYGLTPRSAADASSLTDFFRKDDVL